MPSAGLRGHLAPLKVLETTSCTVGPVRGVLQGDFRPCAIVQKPIWRLWERQTNRCSALFSTASRDLRLTYTGDIRRYLEASKVGVFLIIGTR
jgi:hypothetical protein